MKADINDRLKSDMESSMIERMKCQSAVSKRCELRNG